MGRSCTRIEGQPGRPPKASLREIRVRESGRPLFQWKHTLRIAVKLNAPKSRVALGIGGLVGADRNCLYVKSISSGHPGRRT
jgi:hypothetical protein